MRQAAHEALEREVAARTRELSTANDELRHASERQAETDRRYRAAREELAQASRLGSIGQITAGVAHEINQPVAARSEERRVGKECVSTCRSRRTPST